MADAELLVEVTRGGMVESAHLGHAVIVGAGGDVQAWGDPQALIYPRSSCKMIQALPLLECGADPGPERLALACASHGGAPIHTSRVAAWLADLGLGEEDLPCGVQMPRDRAARASLLREGQAPGRLHNTCSGKHAGFLGLARRLGDRGSSVDPDGPTQRAVRAAFEDVTAEISPRTGTDGCSAPTFACTITGLGRAMAGFAAAEGGSGTGSRAAAMAQLTAAMRAHPELVAGEGRACTDLMRASAGRAVAKMGAEGVYVAIVPDLRIGIAVKIADGADRAASCAIAALLVRAGVLDPADPRVARHLAPQIKDRNGQAVGAIRSAI